MRRRYLILLILIILSFGLGIFIGYLTEDTMTEDKRFENYTAALFRSQIRGNTINLHYTLADPEEYGIKDYPVTLGRMDTASLAGIHDELARERAVLSAFDYENLSRENRLTYDILALSLDTDLMLGKRYLMTEPLSPTLGVQAQLPILLAEYPFRSKRDIEDYLQLLSLTGPYFSQILSFERDKSEAGLFMNSETASRIIAQCQAFVENPDSNYLLSVFEDKIKQCSFLSDAKKEKYLSKHSSVLKEAFIPAYRTLIEGLASLQNTGINAYGLCYFPEGREYYTYLVKSITGVYDSIPAIENRLRQQLETDFFRMKRLLQVQPELAAGYDAAAGSPDFPSRPEDILSSLQTQMAYDFPLLGQTDYEVKYVHPDLAEYLSPAFYLTPPFDALGPNSIYLNTASSLSGMTLFTTLAHEGFPGHLYQTRYFSQTSPNPIRHILNVGGYVEGWATYIERYACGYAPIEHSMGEILWLNRSLNLCLYSLTDIGIHYRGWTPEETSEFLNVFGITDPQAVAEIYQCILEDPANYLQYYVGCLNFMDLREDMEQLLGNDFDLQDFHKKVLEIGPSQFPVLKKYLYNS